MSSPFNSLFSYTGTVQFTGNATLDNALARIHKLVSDQKYKNSDDILFKPRIKGKASKNEVVLHRVVPAIGSFFIKPIFYGKFVEHNGALALKGAFKMSRFSRVSFLIASLFLFSLECMFVVLAISSSGPFQAKIFSVVFIPLTYGVVIAAELLWKRLYRGDVKWISDEIENALRA